MILLVTGSNGFVGRHVVTYLRETTDWDIVPCESDLRTWRSRRVPSEYAEVTAIIHLASRTDVTSFVDDPVPRVTDNIESTMNLLEWARTRPLTHFIQVSTNEVYGPARASEIHTEWSPVRPSTPYSASKVAQEALASAWHHTYGVPTVIVRTMHLFGEGQPAERFIPTAIRKLIAGEPVPIYGKETEEHWVPASRNWLYVLNFADALRWLLERRVDPEDRWNVAGPEVNCMRLVTMIADRLGVRGTVNFVDVDQARPGHELRYAINSSRIQDAGWKCPHSIGAGLNRTIEWVKSEAHLV